MDKWQAREAATYAKDNGVSEEEAVGILFPSEGDVQPAEAGEAEGDVTEENASAKVDTRKAKA